MSDEQSGSGMSVYGRLLAYATPHWRMLIPGVLGMVIYAATQPALAAVMKPMVDGSLIQRDPEAIRMVPFYFIGLFLLRGLASLMSTYFIEWAGRQVIHDLRADMFRRFLQLPTSYYDGVSYGTLLSKLIYNVEQVAAATTKAVTVFIRDTLMVLGLMGWMVYISPKLALIFVLIGPLVALVIGYVSKRFRHISRRIQDSVGEVSHVAQEAIEGHRVVKAFGGQAYEAERFGAVNERNRCLNMKIVFTDAASQPVVQLLSATALAVIIYLATVQSVAANITPGEFISFLAAMGLLLGPVKRLTNINSMVQRGIAAGASIFAVLDVPPERETGDLDPQRVEGGLRFEAVELTYQPEKGPVLHGIDLEVPAGTSVALVGRSGCGKTSLVNLVPRFYEYTGGAIRVDDIEIRDLTREALRRQIAIVSQDVVLFNDSIANNIAYGGLRGAPRETIMDAARAAYLEDVIESMPDGLDTLVGENGVLLSGGQRQRIAIARAILKDAPILILDEATSALDTESERQIQQALERLMRQRTTLIIAHRLSTIERVDTIVVLDQGRIAEQGSHQELLQKGGLYTQLHHLQYHESGDS